MRTRNIHNIREHIILNEHPYVMAAIKGLRSTFQPVERRSGLDRRGERFLIDMGAV